MKMQVGKRRISALACDAVLPRCMIIEQLGTIPTTQKALLDLDILNP